MSTHERIKELRDKAGLSQQEVADRLGIRQSSYANIENGPTELTITKIVHVTNALGVKPSALGVKISDEEIAYHLARPLPRRRRRAALAGVRAE
jgi:transcriptional regulator with XRE-family HTH domain